MLKTIVLISLTIITWLCMCYALFSIAGPRPVYNIFFFMAGIFATVFSLFLFGLEYLPLIFLLVYAGAIAILFLFIVLLVNVESNRHSQLVKRNIFPKKFLIIIIFGIFFLIKFGLFIIHVQELSNVFNTFLNISDMCAETTYYYNSLDINLFGYYIYNYFPLVTLIIGLILYQAMKGAILITLE